MRGLWYAKLHCDVFFSNTSGFPRVNIIPQMIRTRFYLKNTFIRRPNGGKRGEIQIKVSFAYWLALGEWYCYVIILLCYIIILLCYIIMLYYYINNEVGEII